MTPEFAADILRVTIIHALTLAGPLLVAAVIIGVLVSLIQSVTSIQEQTLTFVPKLFIMSVVMIIMSPWMIRKLMEFTVGIIGRIPEMVR